MKTKIDKQCSKCKKIKPLSDFYDDTTHKNNKSSYCKDCSKKNNKKYRGTHRESINKYSNEYSKTKKQKKWRNEYYKQYQKERNKDPFIRLNNGISANIRHSLHGNKNGRHWETLVGYTNNQLKEHIESLFTEGMNWNNYGEWHIDHILPISLWKFETPNDPEFRQCWALCNLQPLWAEENIGKGNRVT